MLFLNRYSNLNAIGRINISLKVQMINKHGPIL